MSLYTLLKAKQWNNLNHMCVHLKWWELLCGGTGSAARPLGDGLGCDKLPAHMVLSLSHLALVCLSLQAQTPSAQPSRIPTLSASVSDPLHTPPSSPPSLIWTIRAKTGEASFLCTHPTSSLSFPVIYFSDAFPPLLHLAALTCGQPVGTSCWRGS